MFLKSKYYVHLAILSMLLFAFSGCGDNSSTGADQPEPPAVPEAVPAEINSSIFQNNDPIGEEFDIFNEAALLAQTASTQLSGGTALGQAYLDFTRSSDSEFDDGTWTWTFSSSETGVDVSVRTIAEQLQEGYQWNVYISGSFTGESVTEFLFLSGFVSESGDSGNWRYFTPNNDGQPILEYQWDVASETQSTFSVIFLDSGADNEQRIDYERNGVDNTLEYTGFSSFSDLVVYWNSENKSGYIDREGEARQCWDESFAETACD